MDFSSSPHCLVSEKYLDELKERPSKMEESCWFCKKWEQHYYWDHLKLTNHRFMKVMLKDFSQGMKISGSFVIIDGWKEFVEGHGIKEGEYLVFTCSGSSSFQVQIFDNGGCLKDACCHTPAESAKIVAKERCQKQNENGYSSHSSKNFYTTGKSKAKQASGHKLSSIRKKCKIEIHSDEATQSDRKTSYGKVYRSSKPAMHCFEQETLKAKKLKSKKRSFDFVETPIVLQIANAIKPESPYFIRLMKYTAVNVRFFMAIPAVFITKHFSNKPEKITLHNPQGKKWDVICSYYCRSWGFKGETWKNFVRENYLNEGDACVFKLKAFTRKNAAMSVRIVRATEGGLV